MHAPPERPAGVFSICRPDMTHANGAGHPSRASLARGDRQADPSATSTALRTQCREVIAASMGRDSSRAAAAASHRPRQATPSARHRTSWVLRPHAASVTSRMGRASGHGRIPPLKRGQRFASAGPHGPAGCQNNRAIACRSAATLKGRAAAQEGTSGNPLGGQRSPSDRYGRRSGPCSSSR